MLLGGTPVDGGYAPIPLKNPAPARVPRGVFQRNPPIAVIHLSAAIWAESSLGTDALPRVVITQCIDNRGECGRRLTAARVVQVVA